MMLTARSLADRAEEYSPALPSVLWVGEGRAHCSGTCCRGVLPSTAKRAVGGCRAGVCWAHVAQGTLQVEACMQTCLSAYSRLHAHPRLPAIYVQVDSFGRSKAKRARQEDKT